MKDLRETKKRIALLIGGGSCVPWVCEALDQKRMEIVFAISHKSQSPGLDELKERGVETAHEPRLRFEKDGRGGEKEYFEMVRDCVLEPKPDLVLCLGWDLILPAFVLSAWHEQGIPTVNLHPALVSEDGTDVQTRFGKIPVIKGEVTHVIAEVLARKLPATGCSLHIIPPSGKVDEGRVIDERVVKVEEDDTEVSLRERERLSEKDLVQEFIRRYQNTGEL